MVLLCFPAGLRVQLRRRRVLKAYEELMGMMRLAVVTGSLVNGTEKAAAEVGGGGDVVDIQKRWKLVLPVHGGGNSGDNHKRRI